MQLDEGRDFPRLRSGRGTETSWTSATFNSTGLCALVMANRLARSERFQGNVNVHGASVEESRRLVGGSTLRARTIDYVCRATGRPRGEILERLFGARVRAAETHRQFAALLAGDPHTGLSVVKRSEFMRSSLPRRSRSEGIPLAYGVRNSRLLAMLEELAVDAGARRSVDDCDFATVTPDSTTLAVNGTPRQIGGSKADPPAQFVAASQMCLAAEPNRDTAILPEDSSFICWIREGSALMMGVFYPFQDELSPAADLYGIVYRVIEAGAAADPAVRAEVLDHLDACVRGVARLLGFTPHDPDETTGQAVVPVSSWRAPEASHPGVLDLSRICGAGSPIITGDGMTRSSLGGLVAAEAAIAGDNVEACTNRALRGYRQLNWELHLLLSTFARQAPTLLARWPNAVLFRQTRSYHRDMWAGAY